MISVLFTFLFNLITNAEKKHVFDDVLDCFTIADILFTLDTKRSSVNVIYRLINIFTSDNMNRIFFEQLYKRINFYANPIRIVHSQTQYGVLLYNYF